MSGKSQKRKGKASKSTGKSKRILEGRKHKSKLAKLQCKVCGAWFENLGQINKHYSVAGHKRKVRPPKRIKFSKDVSQEDIDIALALIELMRNPLKFREKIREAMEKKHMRRRYSPYG